MLLARWSEKTVDVDITVNGGGASGQAGACRLGIARALKDFDTELAEPLRQGGLLTRDGRMKNERNTVFVVLDVERSFQALK